MHVKFSTFAFIKAVTAIGVGHEIKLAIVFDQFIDQSLCALIVHIIIPGTVYQQQFPHQLGRERDRRALAITFLVLVQQAGISFLVD